MQVSILHKLRPQLVAPAVLALGLAACVSTPPVGQFGPYFRKNKHLTLPSGELLTVYRVTYWTFETGPSPQLQLEYEAPFNVLSDTMAVHREARLIWPEFAPYVKRLGLQAAFITASNLHTKSFGVFGTWHVRHFGVGIRRSTDGNWYALGDSLPLPIAPDSADQSILEADGSPMPLLTTPPTDPSVAPSNQRLKLPARVH